MWSEGPYNNWFDCNVTWKIRDGKKVKFLEDKRFG